MSDELKDLISELVKTKSLTGKLGRRKLAEILNKIVLQCEQQDETLCLLRKRIALLSVGQMDLVKVLINSTPAALLKASLLGITYHKGSTNGKQTRN